MAAEPSPNASVPLSMKLLVDTKCQRVLYAEAGKDVIDFLFSLLVLPVGAAVNLLGTDSMAGSVGNLYASVEKLDEAYVLPGAARDALLRPASLTPAAVGAHGSLFRLPPPSSTATPPSPTKHFTCSTNNLHVRRHIYLLDLDDFGADNYSCRNYVTDSSDKICPSCIGPMKKEVQFLSSTPGSGKSVETAAGGGGSSANGFVQGVATYTVMDDLKVAPVSTISGITLLNTFGITDTGVLQEKTVQIDYAEGLKILNASLQSKTVLTDVFLAKKSRKA